MLDRIEIGPAKRARIAEAVENGLKLGDGIVSVLDGEKHDDVLRAPRVSRTAASSLPEMEPRTFSFNSPHGACPECDGLGVAESVDPGSSSRIPSKTIDGGAIAPMSGAVVLAPPSPEPRA